MDTLKDLNYEQKSAICSNANNVCVIAGPGCGKTKTIVHKVVDLLYKGKSPEKILLLTFSKNAIR